MKYPKPKLFVPSQQDLERVGKEIARNLSGNKIVVAGKKKFQGTKTKMK